MTALELLPKGAIVRRAGQLVAVPFGSKRRRINFGRGPRIATLAPWGDVATAYYSTGIPNIEAYVVMPPMAALMGRAARYLGPLFRIEAVQAFMTRSVQSGPAGPTEEGRGLTRSSIWGQVTDERGGRAVSRMQGPEAGATWTVMTSLAVLQRVLAGDAPPGFQTPAMAYGADFVLDGEGVTREDLA